jgi:protein-ribulosamine 3-kinase
LAFSKWKFINNMLQSHYQVQFIDSILKDSLGQNTELIDFHFLYCGNFNLAARVETKAGKYFVKWNKGDHEGMFESEAKSMELLRETNTVHVPKVYGYGKKDDGSYLMLDFVAESTKKEDYWENFGTKLAELHNITNEKFGLHFNNYVGALRQINDFSEDGIQFYLEKRLNIQLERAYKAKFIDFKLYSDLNNIFSKVTSLFPKEKPSLLHGDLWSGNIMVGANGHAALVDPSAYYGLREAEIAFTTLFGGFKKEFYDAYTHSKPLEPGFKDRIDLYNLYPLMVHLNLFGGGYLESIKQIVKKYL